MTGRLDGKVAIVTGAGSGIGRAVAREFAAQGAMVAALDVNGEAAEAMVDGLGGGRAIALPVDVRNAAAVDRAVEVAGSEFGRIDVLANCAGILDGYASATNTDDELWARIIDVNLRGVFFVSRATIPHMAKIGSGSIVNIASIAGLVAGGGGAAYTASKHGVIGLTRQISYDYGKSGIRANAICPGAIETAMTRDILASGDLAVIEAVRSVAAGRHGQPEEVAKLALYLASDDSAFVHGAVIAIDGGWTLR